MLSRVGRRWRSRVPSRRARLARWRPSFEPLETRRLLTLGLLYTVTTELDVVDPADGLLSLREAVNKSNQSADLDDTVAFAASLANKPALLPGGQIAIYDK